MRETQSCATGCTRDARAALYGPVRAPVFKALAAAVTIRNCPAWRADVLRLREKSVACFRVQAPVRDDAAVRGRTGRRHVALQCARCRHARHGP